MHRVLRNHAQISRTVRGSTSYRCRHVSASSPQR
ncbi:hypothetical protein PENARI_c008G12338 [Penicillium arizonense]|uniref:Uncharacterized protein n=1 Tax=Penicillium arizonense TaxID=1835702 RepID=A0A1F5LJC4_PENAI|nr:hypothetical protein PENARI_c008G12338 [Penicillium arizonense]OGE53313.1 hypothetical protein PENARI_c008G12338 [Penicillium arizonense]